MDDDGLTRTKRRIIANDQDPVYAGMAASDRVRENQLRRQADRKGLQIEKERAGGYMLIDARTNAVVAGGSPIAYAFNLDDVEAYLKGYLTDERTRSD